jgi:hypothetical protein
MSTDHQPIPTAADNEAFFAEMKARTGRVCGSCSLCCKLLDVPEVEKPENDWCAHCRPGHGCRIYARRPYVCATYSCLWLIRKDWGEAWFPPKARIVADLHVKQDTGQLFCRFHLDPAYPNRWRDQPYYSWIKHTALVGLTGRNGIGERSYTVVSLRGKWILILPHRECAFGPGIVLPLGDDHFEFVPTKDEAGARRLDALLQTLDAAARRALQTDPGLAVLEAALTTRG